MSEYTMSRAELMAMVDALDTMRLKLNLHGDGLDYQSGAYGEAESLEMSLMVYMFGADHADDILESVIASGEAPSEIVRVMRREALYVAYHVDYPHLPGTLHDCPACEAQCFCKPGEAECVYLGEHKVFSTDRDDLEMSYGESVK